MSDDIQNQPAQVSVEEQPPTEVVATEQVELPGATEIVEESSDLAMADSTSATNELTIDVTENHSLEQAVAEGNNEVPATDIRPEEHPVATEQTPKSKQQKSPATVKRTLVAPTAVMASDRNVTPTGSGVGDNAQDPQTPQGTRPPKTPTSRVRSGRVEKSGSVGNLRCPVKGCGQTFTGRNPRQSLWHHLKYYATRGLPDRVEFEKAHGEAHADMKRDAEPKGTPVERNRISSSDYRKKNPEKAKTSARLSNFRARARKKGINDERDIEEHVLKWEKEWQEKQAKEASEYFSGILLSAFE
ncbi:hypothetical protein FN846DRAFT_458578 [Sphaerosporella brunnea]|uniref:Uncharacterized protein n=1 Tax=Sphaerosporella brunnea TaxID=1250544 RepID=A0A5J5EGB4_9PEZI|nr:hypothetical protein FN846DRAFT_458578 [Sphaerosporella brunnea]